MPLDPPDSALAPCTVLLCDIEKFASAYFAMLFRETIKDYGSKEAAQRNWDDADWSGVPQPPTEAFVRYVCDQQGLPPFWTVDRLLAVPQTNQTQLTFIDASAPPPVHLSGERFRYRPTPSLHNLVPCSRECPTHVALWKTQPLHPRLLRKLYDLLSPQNWAESAVTPMDAEHD